MRPSKSFLQATGIAGLIAGVLTLGIVLLPQFYDAPTSLAERIALHENDLYHARQWFSFLNVFAILAVGWGLAAHRLRASPGAASTGMLFLLFYGAAELLGRSALIFARDYRWMHELAHAEGPRRAELLQLIEGFDGIWAGWFVLILITFTLATSLLGWSARGGGGLQRATSWLLFAASALAAITLLSAVVPGLQAPAGWAYPAIQPPSRLVMGAFLLREARQLRE